MDYLVSGPGWLAGVALRCYYISIRHQMLYRDDKHRASPTIRDVWRWRFSVDALARLFQRSNSNFASSTNQPHILHIAAPTNPSPRPRTLISRAYHGRRTHENGIQHERDTDSTVRLRRIARPAPHPQSATMAPTPRNEEHTMWRIAA